MDLIPKEVTVESTFKSFGLDAGKSDGTTISVTCSVPEGATQLELAEAVLREAYRTSLQCLKAEAAKGTISKEFYEERSIRMRDTFKRVLSMSEQVRE